MLSLYPYDVISPTSSLLSFCHYLVDFMVFNWDIFPLTFGALIRFLNDVGFHFVSSTWQVILVSSCTQKNVNVYVHFLLDTSLLVLVMIYISIPYTIHCCTLLRHFFFINYNIILLKVNIKRGWNVEFCSLRRHFWSCMYYCYQNRFNCFWEERKAKSLPWVG